MRKEVILIFILLGMTGLLGCSGHKENSSAIADNREIEVLERTSIVEKKDSTLPLRINASELPQEFGHNGTFQEAWVWYDKNGKNVLILSVADKKEKAKETEEEEKSRELFAKQYLVREPGMKPEILWELYDLEKACIFDITAEYLFSPVITDLDNNQIKESFIVYKLACRSDVSPARMKIVAHENQQKYVLRGQMYMRMNSKEDTITTDHWEPDLSKLSVKEDDSMGHWGRYENSKDFAGAPPSFLEQARTLWLENFVEN